ncbi:MAG: hypothetical protein P4L73_15630, partial [Caulobacteraceae bacterium]|nr:hypothetical protein [Caulobacteraceae bacterium]
MRLDLAVNLGWNPAESGCVHAIRAGPSLLADLDRQNIASQPKPSPPERFALDQHRRPSPMDVVRVCSGNFIEMYDFMVFGYYASNIAAAFFPSHDKFVSLMLSLATFGAGFLMRPLGAVVL